MAILTSGIAPILNCQRCPHGTGGVCDADSCIKWAPVTDSSPDGRVFARDQVIRMVAEAGGRWINAGPRSFPALIGLFERFAEAAAADVREKSAAKCDDLAKRALAMQKGDPGMLANVMLRQVATLGCGECAAAIRGPSGQAHGVATKAGASRRDGEWLPRAARSE